ncbi:MAG: tRNA uridine-5-carboxymethylaminomethyl(34) synthesis enzyme MnmG, partial [Proteobacteria bacterium]|nr:tRNA uridine-5-carboxymethylaminomethyl(34) synthesis enzyme MnmG [Pseudomonadota bacterium]
QPGDIPPGLADEIGGVPGRDIKALDLLRRPQVSYRQLARIAVVGEPEHQDPWLWSQVREQVAIQAGYSGYIERQEAEIRRLQRKTNTVLPGDLDYLQVGGLSAEVSEKLAAARPATIGEAARIPGVTPAGVSLLLVHLKKREYKRSA